MTDAEKIAAWKMNRNRKKSRYIYVYGERWKIYPEGESKYDRLELESYSGKALRPKDALERWNQFLGENQTKIDLQTGSQAVDRIASKDGTRSVRFGEHEEKNRY